MRTRSIQRAGLLMAAMWSAGGAAALPVASVAAFEETIARLDLNGSGDIFNALVKERLPAKEAGRPDPLLDRLLVEQMAVGGEVVAARPVIERVLHDPRTRDQDHVRLLLAGVLEGEGTFEEAQRLYETVAAAPGTSAADRLAATLGQARVQMSVDPAAAARTLAAINRGAVSKASLWQVDLLVARADAMTSAVPDARAALDRAWAESVDAPLIDAAPLRIATDYAIAAGRAGDRGALVAMLAVDRANRSPNSFQNQLASNLPVCGTGVTPEDSVAIAVAHQPGPGQPRVELVWASRPGIARAFLAAAGSGAPTVTDGRVAPFVLRCRTAPSPDVTVRNTIDGRIVGWMTGLGAYPLAGQLGDNDPVALASLLGERQARYGATSVMLLPVLLRIMAATTPDMLGDDDARRRALANLEKMQAIYESNHAPADLMLLSHLSVTGLQIATSVKTETQGIADAQAIVTQAARDPNLSPDMLYAIASGTAQSPKVPSGYKAATLASARDVLSRSAPPGDPRTTALALRLYRLRTDTGDQAGAASAIAGLRLPPDLCVLGDPAPHMVSSAISSDDYPSDLTFANMRGFTRVEFALDPTGIAQAGRLLVTDPAFAFDAIAAARIPTIRYDPPRIGGKVTACRGETQSIVWQLPD